MKRSITFKTTVDRYGCVNYPASCEVTFHDDVGEVTYLSTDVEDIDLSEISDWKHQELIEEAHYKLLEGI